MLSLLLSLPFALKSQTTNSSQSGTSHLKLLRLLLTSLFLFFKVSKQKICVSLVHCVDLLTTTGMADFNMEVS